MTITTAGGYYCQPHQRTELRFLGVMPTRGLAAPLLTPLYWDSLCGAAFTPWAAEEDALGKTPGYLQTRATLGTAQAGVLLFAWFRPTAGVTCPRCGPLPVLLAVASDQRHVVASLSPEEPVAATNASTGRAVLSQEPEQVQRFLPKSERGVEGRLLWLMEHGLVHPDGDRLPKSWKSLAPARSYETLRHTCTGAPAH